MPEMDPSTQKMMKGLNPLFGRGSHGLGLLALLSKEGFALEKDPLSLIGFRRTPGTNASSSLSQTREIDPPKADSSGMGTKDGGKFGNYYCIG